MAECLAEFLDIPLATSADYPLSRCGPPGLTPEFIARAQALPLKQTDDGLVLAMADPTDEYTVKAVRLAAGGAVLPWAAVPSELKSAFARLYGGGALVNGTAPTSGAAREDVRRLADLASEEPAIRYVNSLIAQAATQRASDIHIGQVLTVSCSACVSMDCCATSRRRPRGCTTTSSAASR
jgi:general secretion pathway protein E